MVDIESSDETKKINFSITDLFPTPLYAAEMSRAFTEEELEFIKKTANGNLTKNTGNYVSENKYILDSLSMKSIKEEIQIHLNQYLKYLECPRDDIEIYITQSWINFTRKQEYHHNHNHYNSYLSGCLYIDVDFNVDTICFHKPQHQMNYLRFAMKNHNVYNSDITTCSVKPGGILLFPSSVVHSVPTSTSNKTRVSLSFNTFLRGTLGDVIEATYLQLK